MKVESSCGPHAHSFCARAAALSGVLWLTACLEQHTLPSEDLPAAPAAHQREERLDPALRELLARDGQVDVIVLLDEPPSQPAADAGPRGSSTQAASVSSATPFEAAQDNVLGALDGAEVELLRRYAQLPYLSLRVRAPDALALLADLPEVAHVYEDKRHEAMLTESLALIKQPQVAAQGFSGSGTAVAVLDTGCDYAREAFGTCSAPGASGCKVAFARDFGSDDGARDANGHGTNVSAIVLGVAPATKVLALDVFDGASASSSVILSAIDWVVQNKSTYNIVAMNLSLGSGLFSAACPNDVFAAAMGRARTAGVLPVAATGNNGSASSVGSPACVPSVVSVGAVHDASYGSIGFPSANCTDATTAADKLACFSNSASFISLLAPGSRISAGGVTASGTSQASPHVAGAAAVLRAALPNATLDAIVARLTATGPLITDARNGVSKRRLDLSAALAGAEAPDIAGPSVSVAINGGAATARSASVSLAVTASDRSGVASMCVSNSESCTKFVTFAASISWKLATGDGEKTVRVWVKDTLGNVGSATDSIALDTKVPTEGNLSAAGGNASVSLSWSGFADAGGALTYRLVYAADSAPKSCADGALAYEGTASSFVHRELVNGRTYAYRLCALDAAGNTSPGKTASARAAPEYGLPTGTLRINDGAAATSSATVNLTITATDASRVSAMCLSTTTKCSSWREFASTTSYALGKTNSTVAVSLWLRDEWNNVSSAPISASILVDAKAPTMGTTFSATASPGSVRLAWTEATDTGGVGVDGYRLVFASGATAPASCQTGQLLSEGRALSFVHAGLTSKATYSYRLCAKDRVGNWAAGKTIKATLP